MWRVVRNYLAHAAAGNPRGWYPLLGVYYLTYACDFRCPYCSDGNCVPYHRLPNRELPPAQVLEVLRAMRPYADHLVLTGGEPLQYGELDAVLAGVPALGYDGVILTTNGYLLPPHLPAVNAAVDWLVVSLDTLDHAKADRWFGVGPGALQRILDHLDQAAALPGRRYEIAVSAVATPANLEDLVAVYRYCRERGFRFAVCPQLLGVKPHPALVDNPAYRRLYDRLIREKRRGGPVNGSIPYLEHMRDLRKFSCRPSTVLAVAPAGDVFYPCLEIGKVAGNLLQDPDLHAIRRQGRQRFGPEPKCDNRCHSACALGFSLILNRPQSLALEAVFQLKAAWQSARRRRSRPRDPVQPCEPVGGASPPAADPRVVGFPAPGRDPVKGAQP